MPDVRVERYSGDAYRLLVAGEIAAFALRLSSGRWALFDTKDRRRSVLSYESPGEVGKVLERQLASGIFP